MTKSTLREKLEYYSENEEYEEWFKVLQDWLKLTTNEKVDFVCEHAVIDNFDSLKVWISMDRLKKQVLGIERFRKRGTLDTSDYDVQNREMVYCGKAVLRENPDMFVIPTDDNEKDILLILKIKLT